MLKASKINNLHSLQLHYFSSLYSRKLRNAALCNIQRRQVTTHHQWEDTSITRDNTRDFLDTNLDILFGLGILKMNREHRYNTLTPHYIRSLKRGIETLNMDDNVKLIYMAPQKGEHFSNGTDFRTIMHHKKEKNYGEIAEYLNDIYSLQIQVAQTNKPIIAAAPGHSFNSGASLLQAVGMPMVTLDSLMSFNDVTFGFVPHGGSSFYLSRLPNEIGTFLALTGLPFPAADAIEFKLAEQLVHTSEGYENDLAEFLHSIHMPIPNARLLTDNFKQNPWRDYLNQRNSALRDEQFNDMTEMRRKKRYPGEYDEFIEPKDNIPSLTAESNYYYKQEMIKFANARRKREEPGYLQQTGNLHQNYYDYVMSYMKDHIGHPYSKKADTFYRHQDVINRCFYPSKVEEIIQLLKKEESTFAKLCLQRMEANSMLSMKITLKMLRDARNKDYKGAFETELNVGLNKIQDADFDLGVSKILMAPSKISDPNPGFRRDVPKDLVDSYFEKSKYAENIDLGVVEKAMLPTRFYYEKFTDQVRLWVNETSTTQSNVRKYFDIEMKEALRGVGIDVRDRALTMESARGQLYQAEQMERRYTAYTERMKQLSTDPFLRENYYNGIKTEIEKLEKNEDNLFKMVNEKIQQIYEEAYLAKLEQVYDKSKEAHDLEKRRMFIRFKQFLFRSRVLIYMDNDMEQTVKQLQSMPERLIHLTEKWDQSYRDMEHPEIQKSWLWYLSKAIGKVNLAPPQLAKQYLTNPAVKKASTLYTFDKDELVKLRKDILANPEKYETILLSGRDNNEVYDNFNYAKEKDTEYEYWYRVLNQGRCPVDNIKHHHELRVFKDFVANVEKKALGTLKLTVSRLILDFENTSNINEVVEYEQDAKESKTSALKRLMNLVQSEKSEKINQKKLKSEQTKLVESKRDLSDIKQAIQTLTSEDKELKLLFGSQNEADLNPLIKSMRKDLLEDLYKLIEIVLLNNNSGKVSKGVLEERYAAISSPVNADSSTASLVFIDKYLAETSNKDVVKQAIYLLKPYFLIQAGEKIQQEMVKVFDAFHLFDTSEQFLFYYFMNTQNPELRNSPIVESIKQFNGKKERQKYLDIAFPEQSYTYNFKMYIGSMGQQENKYAHLPIEQQEDILNEQAKEIYRGLNELQQSKVKQEEQYQQEIEKRRDFQLSQPYHPASEMSISPELSFKRFNYGELRQIVEGIHVAEAIQDTLEDIHDDLYDKMTIADWMGVVKKCLIDFDLDVDQFMRHSITQQYMSGKLLDQAQNILGQKKATWTDMAEYGDYLKQYAYATEKEFYSKDGLQRYKEMTSYLSGDLMSKDLSVEQEASQASIFEKITSKNYSYHIKHRADGLRNEIEDLAKVQARLESDNQLKVNIKSKIEHAPEYAKSYINALLTSESKYVDYQALNKIVLTNDYSKINEANLFKSDLLKQDFLYHDKNQKAGILKDYEQIKLDVVSLAELQQQVASPQFTEKYSQFYQNAFKTILKDIDNSLRSVSNERRKDITLGAFLSKSHHLNAGAMSEFAGDILKNRLKDILGQGEESEAEKSIIDWEYADVRTNPYFHKVEDENTSQVKDTKLIRNVKEELTEYVDGILNKQELRKHNSKVSVTNELSGATEILDESHVDYIIILRDAVKVVTMPLDFEPIRAQYENMILKNYCQLEGEEYNEEKVQLLVKQYTEARMRDAFLRGELQEKVNDKYNGHIYLKVLKESILNELGLGQKTDVFDLSAESIKESNSNAKGTLEFEAKYNTNRINDTNQIGYENFEERLVIGKERINENEQGSLEMDIEGKKQRDKETRDLAHESVFDKLLADYFLSKRDQYAKSRDLIDQLNTKLGQKEGENKDPKHMSTQDYPFDKNHSPNSKPNIALSILQQKINKFDEPFIKPTNYMALMELDIATAQAIQDGKCGLEESLRQTVDPELLDIPEYFMSNDVRMPANVWVENKMKLILGDIFEARKKVEKNMNRRELIAYDRVLAQVLNKETLIKRVKAELDKDMSKLNHIGQLSEMNDENIGNKRRQDQKTPNSQPAFNESISDEDSLFKFLSYSGMLEKTRREQLPKDKDLQDKVAFGVHTFPEFYKEELMREAKREKKREYKMDPQDYEPKKDQTLYKQQLAAKQGTVYLGFRNNEQRKADYFTDYEKLLENKKETQDRTQLFYILEQFHAQAQETPDPFNAAQEAINEYFRDSENTQFFDKNKIQ